ncbi:putative addiction module antidote protein [Desulfobulbus sp. F5]|nr:putative addiction module antidote protein [Desulfobulbus sp. F5]
MEIEIKSYNPFDYLETKDEINDYMNNAYMDGDPRVFLVALGYLAKKQGMAEVAKKAGLNRESLYKALAGEGNPRFSTVNKVIKALGCKLAVA